jgi:hypothetical protein
LKANQLLKWILAFVLVLSAILPLGSKVEAATTYSATVNTANLIVREKPSLNAKKVGVLKKGTIVNVYSQTKSGWSEIWYKYKKAYVTTKHLKFSKKISFLRDTSKVYVYKDSKGSTVSYMFAGKSKEWYIWDIIEGSGDPYFEKETKDGLGVVKGNYSYSIISYPLYAGKIDRYANGEKVKFVSLSKTIKTPAGTFKNCVEIKEEKSGFTYYYARGVGLVLKKQGNKINQQLIKTINVKEYRKAQETAIKDLIYRNADHLEKEDYNAYKNDLAKQFRDNPELEAIIVSVFENFDIQYEILDYKLLKLTNNTAIVEVKQKSVATYIADGFTFKDNISTIVHTITKEDGKFVFSLSEVKNVEYLE